jgi:hypothetical protein
MLDDFLSLREASIKQPFSKEIGLGGIVFEGEPGLGKSELAIEGLRARGFSKRSPDTHSPPDDEKYFYHLPAGTHIKTKRDILLRAFKEGAIVLCDEINTTASQEALLNQLLMGKSPNGPPDKPGFLLIGTQNPSTMAGRAKTSTALLHRMHYRVLPHYTRAEMTTILSHMGLPNRRTNALIEQYTRNKDKNKHKPYPEPHRIYSLSMNFYSYSFFFLISLFFHVNNPISEKAFDVFQKFSKISLFGIDYKLFLNLNKNTLIKFSNASSLFSIENFILISKRSFLNP